MDSNPADSWHVISQLRRSDRAIWPVFALLVAVPLFLGIAAGLILGRFQLTHNTRFIVGGGYQFALSPNLVTAPMTPACDHNFVLSARLGF